MLLAEHSMAEATGQQGLHRNEVIIVSSDNTIEAHEAKAEADSSCYVLALRHVAIDVGFVMT